MNLQKITKQELKKLRGQLLSGQNPQKRAAYRAPEAKERSAAYEAECNSEDRSEQDLENEMAL